MRPLVLLLLILLILLSLLCCLSRSAAITALKGVKGFAKGSLTVTCRYDTEYETVGKRWCRVQAWRGCRTLAETTETKPVGRQGRVTIRDHQGQRQVTVTMERLRPDDAGTYRCEILGEGRALYAEVTVTVGPAITAETMDTLDVTPNTLQSLFSSVCFLILLFLKVPVLLAMMGAVLYVNWPQRSHRKPTENP